MRAFCILTRVAQYAEDSRWQSQVDSNTISVTCPCSRTRADNHLVSPEIRNELVDERKYSRSAPIYETLTADFDNIGFGKNLGGLVPRGLFEQR